MYVGEDWPDMSPTEERRLSFDFSNDLDLTLPEVISSAVWFCEVPPELNTLQDPDSQSRLVGGATVSGSIVIQKVQGLLPGIIYRMRCLATTQAAQPELFSHVRCVAPV